MVTVNKNNILNSENITPKKNKVLKEDIDGVFAELFSLVNMENIENKDKTNKNLLDLSLKNKEFVEFEKNNLPNTDNSEENILAAARSLVSLFYKELNLDKPNEELKENEYINSEEVLIKNQKNSDNPKLVNRVETKESELKVPISELKKNENFLVSKEPLLASSVKKKISEKNQKNFQNTKNNFNENETDNQLKKTSPQQIFDDDAKLFGNREILAKKVKNKISKKKLNKNKINSDSYKVDVRFENKEIKSSKDFTLNFQNTFQQYKDQKSQINLVERSNTNKNHNAKTLVNNLENQKDLANKNEILDLMESAWGERFVKIVKNKISRGVNRINLSLEPKNLGKLRVEVEITGKDTDLKILSDNKQTITILNENSQRLNEMFKEDNLKLSNFSTMLNQNNDNSKNRNSEKNTDNSIKKIEDKVQVQKNNEIIKTKKSNHKVDKIA